MSRIEELKEKMKNSGGFFGLSKEEKEEYRGLTGADSGDKITISRAELEGLIAEATKKAMTPHINSSGELYNKWSEFKEVKDSNQTATLKVWDFDGKRGLIVKQDYLKTVWNEETHKHDKVLYAIDVLYDDKDVETKEVDALDLVKTGAVETVEILKVDRKKMIMKSGKVIVTPKDKQGYTVRRADNSFGRAEGGYETDLIVEKYDEVFTVKRENGQMFDIKGIYLNS